MLDTLKIIAEELAESFIRPRIEKAKTDLRLAIVTAVIVMIFSLLAITCLLVVVFLNLSDLTSPQDAALILFGFCVVMCIGAILAYGIGKRVEQDKYERKLEGVGSKFSERLPRGPDIDIAQYAQDLFAGHKASALIAATVLGIVIGVKPSLVFRSAARIFTGSKRRRRTRDEGHRRRR